MNNQNLLIYDSKILYEILNELNEFLNFRILNISKKDLNYKNFDDLNNYIVLSFEKNINLKNLILLNSAPIKISKLLVKINVEFLKQRFNKQSNINVGSFKVNINSREISYNFLKLRLTEKEINTIIYLSKKKKATSVHELQKEVWGYQTELETHTVETHIHRLKKKIKEKFKNDSLIISTKNGYKIK